MEGGQPRRGFDWQGVRLLAVLAGAFPALDTSVNVAFPDIDTHFGLAIADLKWIVISYLFTYGALLLAAGRVGDSIGYRRLVWVGGLVSIVGLVGCAAAPSFALFLVGRVVQGVGTALLLAGAPALLTTSAADDGRQGQAVSWFQASSMVGLAIGPIVGGPLVALGGWRTVYWYRVPIAVALMWLAARLVAGSPASGPKPAPGLARTLVKRQGFVRANGLNLIANAAMFPTWLLVPSLLVDEIGVAVIIGGLVLAASPAMSALGSVWVGRRVDRSSPSTFVRAGLLVQAAGLALLGWLGPGGSALTVALGAALVGAGLGIFSVPNMHQVMSALPMDRQGVAGGLSLMMRTVGVVGGVLAASALFDSVERSDGFDPAFRLVFLVAAAITVVAAVLATSRDA